MKTSPSNRHRAQGGFTLSEICVSLGIASLMLLPLAGLLASSLSLERQASHLISTAQLATETLGKLGRDEQNHALLLREPDQQLVLHRPGESPQQNVLLVDERGRVIDAADDTSPHDTAPASPLWRVTLETRWHEPELPYYSVSVTINTAVASHYFPRNRHFLTKIYVP